VHLREVSASTVARKLTAGAEYRELCFVKYNSSTKEEEL